MSVYRQKASSPTWSHIPLIPTVTALTCLLLFALIAHSNYQIALQNEKNQARQALTANAYVLTSLIEQQIEKAQALALLHNFSPQDNLKAFIDPLYLQQDDLIAGWMLTQQTRVVETDPSNLSTSRIGNDLSQDPYYSNGLNTALQTRRVTMAPLYNGQEASSDVDTLSCFVPIFDYENDLPKNVQGCLIIMINMDRLMGQSGLLTMTRSYRLGLYDQLMPIFSNFPTTITGDLAIKTEQTITIPIEVNNAKWTLYAQPIDGWQPGLLAPLAIMLTGMALALVSSGYVNRLIGARNALNKQVEERTEELRDANAYLEESLATLQEKQSELEMVNSKLEDSLEALQIAQDQLIRNEKLASLGELVGGVAHEINTPLGIAVTVASFLKDKCNHVYSEFKTGQLKRSDLEHHLESSSEAFSSLELSLQRSVDIIGSFKTVAVDQSNLEARSINIGHYLNEVLTPLMPRLQKDQHTLQINCPEQLEIVTFPGALAHIITNLVLNSLIHGFEGQGGGTIILDVDLLPCSGNEPIVQLKVSDNGCGIPENLSERIFDPFFTTKRIKGCTGLGLHIVNNMATQVLKGQLSLSRPQPPETGAIFTLRFPA